MDAQFRCQIENRRKEVLSPKDTQGNDVSPEINGIDYLEVSADQKTLEVHFVHLLPVDPNQVPANEPALNEQNVRIEGGVQIRDIQVEKVAVSGKVLQVEVNQPGDFSTYRLRLVISSSDPNPPPGYDPPLSAIDFSFKADCPSDFDCKQSLDCPPRRIPQLEIDYLAKDYSSFRRLMLDRLSVLMPGWTERNPADVQIALVELMAYVGDSLSYAQDAAATEAYLGTSRQRISVRRHARLLDYAMHDGCNARSWVHFEVKAGGDADGQTLQEGAALSTKGGSAAKGFGAVVFETMHDLELHSAHNEILFHTWSDEECCLPSGSTRATLLSDPSAPLTLEKGDILIFEEVCSPTTGIEADADPAHRHPVRLKTAKPAKDLLRGLDVMEIEWHEADALPFPLCLSIRIQGELKENVSVARANIVLADQGKTTEEKDFATVPPKGLFRPSLRQADLSFGEDYDHPEASSKPASGLLTQDPRQALPLVDLNDQEWRARRDLLGSDRFAAEFVAEVDQQGRARLRFGDDLLGKKPSPGTAFKATYRVGNGPQGNVGAEAIARLIDGVGFKDVEAVRNPLPARGGTLAESMEEVRQYAPQAFRTQQRAVTEADWAEVAERHPEVQKASACFRWTGSWYTVFVTIDRKGGRPVRGDPQFDTELRQHLEQFRLAGYDLEVNDPIFVPLDIQLLVCAKAGYFRSQVELSLLAAFDRFERPGGGRGFFHPDNFTFGQPVYLSRIYSEAMKVAGVASVEIKRFQRWNRDPANEIRDGVLKTAPLEVIRLDNDPSLPENGKIEFDVQGGL